MLLLSIILSKHNRSGKGGYQRVWKKVYYSVTYKNAKDLWLDWKKELNEVKIKNKL